MAATVPYASELNAAPGQLTFIRSDTLGALTINVSIGGASTASPGDYTLGPIVIPDGQSQVTIPLTPVDDGLVEGVETVIVQLAPGAYSIGLPSSAQINIADNDMAATVSTPLPVAYEDVPLVTASTLDPDGNRRAVFRVGFSNLGTFPKYVSTQFTGPAIGAATLGTDYTLTYKIGGRSMGAGLGYQVRPPLAYQAGATQITVEGGSSTIPPGATIVFAGHATTYTTFAGLGAVSGTLTISPALTAGVAHGEGLTVTPPVPTGFAVNVPGNAAAGAVSLAVDGGFGTITIGSSVIFAGDVTTYTAAATLAGPNGTLFISPALTGTVNDNASVTVTPAPIPGFTVAQANAYPTGTTVLALDSGIGGFDVGDVIRFTGLPNSDYVVTATTGFPGAGVNSGTITISGFTGPVGSGGGTAAVLTDGTVVLTHLPVPLVGNGAYLLLPPTSAGIEFGVTPVHDGIPEAAEGVIMTLTGDANYLLQSPSDGLVTIADDDVIANLTLDPAATQASEPSIPGRFLVTLTSAFPRAIAVPYNVTGTATPTTDYAPLSGLLTIPAGSTSGLLTITPVADAAVEGTETVIVTLLPSNDYRFSGAPGSGVNPSATMSLLDFKPVVSLAAVNTTEGSATPGSFTVSYPSAGLDQDVIVAITYAGTASGADYTGSLPATITIPAGTNSSAPVLFTALTDALAESTETIVATITPNTAAYQVGTASATLGIADANPTISIGTPVDSGEGLAAGSFIVSYPGASLLQTFTVPLTYSGTASGADFTAALPASAVINSGTSTVTIPVPVFDDALNEGPETLIVTIGSDPSYHLGTTTTTLTLSDNEPVISIGSPVPVTEGIGSGSFTVTYAGPATHALVTVPLTYGGTAVPGDFTAPASVDIPANQTSATVTVTATADSILEATETLIATITPDAGYAVGAASATLNIIDNHATVVGVSSPESNGTYGTTDTLHIDVQFSLAVTVIGTPTVTLATGTSTAAATYQSGSGSTHLIFTYTVAVGHTSSDLDYASSSALTLNGGNILCAGIPAVLTLPTPGAAGSLGANKALVIDGADPGGKPTPGTSSSASGGGCGLGSGIATLALALLLTLTRLRRQR
jgi:hypothetical protein